MRTRRWKYICRFDEPGRPEANGTLDEMRNRLARWMTETGDPILHGPIVTPPGAVYNDPDGTSPGEPTLKAS